MDEPLSNETGRRSKRVQFPDLAAALGAIVFMWWILPLGPALADCQQSVIRVHGTSLDPLVKDGATLEGWMGQCPQKPRHGDLVLFRNGRSDLPLLKIVVGLSGDRFALQPQDNGTNLLVNGKIVKTSAGRPYSFSGRQVDRLGLYVRDYHGVIPAGAYLVLGDQAGGTLDSSQIGLVGEKDILGFAPLKEHPAELRGHPT